MALASPAGATDPLDFLPDHRAQELRVPGLLEPMPVRELCPSPVHENRRIFNFRQLVLGCIKTKFSNSVCSFFKLYTIVPMPFPEF